MATNQYIGARYVPLFAEPIEWDGTKQYEPLTIVSHKGNSYTSRQFVPSGIDISNESFWALTGNYNAQVEQYREEVKAYDGRITTAQETADNAKSAASNAISAVAEEKSRAEAKESEIQSLAETNETDISHLDAQMAATTGSELLTKIANETSRAETKESEIQSLAKTNETYINTDGTVMLAFGDSFGDESTEWACLLAAKFGKTCKTYCIGGDVWPFTNGLTNAINEFSTDAKKRTIAFAVAYGGINNIIDSPLTDSTSIESFITRFNANFPNVPLYVAPMNQCSPLNTNFPKIYRNAFISANALESALSHFSGNFILMKQSIFYNMGAIDLWKDDLLHPNEKGNITIANHMATVMQGGKISFPLQQFGAYNTEHVTFSGDVWFDGDSIHTPFIKCINNTAVYFYSNGLRYPAYDNDDSINGYAIQIPVYYISNDIMTLGQSMADVTINSDNPQMSISVKNVSPNPSDTLYILPTAISLRNITNKQS